MSAVTHVVNPATPDVTTKPAKPIKTGPNRAERIP